MSVINQMLVDLERRRASGEELKRIPNHVRALPSAPSFARNVRPVVAAVSLATAALAVTWWWLARQPVDVVAPAPAVASRAAPPVMLTPEQEAVEQVARRMSFELAHLPETVNTQQETATSDGGVSAASVIGRDKPAAAQKPPASTSPSSVSPAVQPRNVAAAQKPVVVPRAEISKQVREPTPRQRADAEYARGVTALHQGRSDDARAAFESALQIVPAYHSARQALVGVMLDARQLVEAARILEDGLQLAPAQYGFAMALARLQVEQGDIDAGVRTLSRSIEHAGGSAEYAAFYAGLLQRQQKHAEAVEMFERALRLRGNSGVWLLGMGLSLDALGRGAEAQEAYRRAKAAGNLPGDLAAFADQRLR